MPREQTEELLARVAGRAGDGDARSVDGRCACRTPGAGSDLIPGCPTSVFDGRKIRVSAQQGCKDLTVPALPSNHVL